MATVTSAYANFTSFINVNLGLQNWENPTNAASSNDTYATFSGLGIFYSDQLWAYGWTGADETSPDAVFRGIQVRTEAHYETGITCIYGSATEMQLRMLRSGVIVGDDKATGDLACETDSTRTHGGVADMWGITLTRDQLSNPNTGVVFRCSAISDSTVTLVSLDWIGMAVTYEPGRMMMCV